MRKFFGNYSVQTQSKLVKTDPDGTQKVMIDTGTDPMMGPEIAAAYSTVAKDFITHAAVTIGVTYAVCKIVGRLCR